MSRLQECPTTSVFVISASHSPPYSLSSSASFLLPLVFFIFWAFKTGSHITQAYSLLCIVYVQAILFFFFTVWLKQMIAKVQFPFSCCHWVFTLDLFFTLNFSIMTYYLGQMFCASGKEALCLVFNLRQMQGNVKQ